MSIKSLMPANHLILCCPLLLLPSIFPSVSVFSSELALRIRWPKDWSFSFSISPSNEYSGLISFRIDCFGHLTVQGTLKSLLQYHSLKASILLCSAFFMVQLSQPFVTTGKTIALTTWTSVSKVMSLLFNTLSRFVIAFLPRRKSLLISWLLEKEMVIHSSILAWKIPWVEEPGRLQSMGSLGVGHDWATSLSFFTSMHWRRKWKLTPVFLPGESQGQGSLVGCCLWGRTESDTTEVT